CCPSGMVSVETETPVPTENQMNGALPANRCWGCADFLIDTARPPHPTRENAADSHDISSIDAYCPEHFVTETIAALSLGGNSVAVPASLQSTASSPLRC
ncbi:MAG: hypothetical protein LBP68_06965, partial [Acidobacteriota bacterium]|nr:hypothetical protein [Acidobacteriota bacterium]